MLSSCTVEAEAAVVVVVEGVVKGACACDLVNTDVDTDILMSL